MKSERRRMKKKWITEHRKERYLHSIQKVIGWQKLQQAEGKKK